MLETEQRLFNQVITSEEELREIIGQAQERTKRKIIRALDQHCREFIAASPFLVIGTTNAEGQGDVSPRGDAPGFVLVLDEKRLVIPERPGNKLADTLTNILVNPHVGLIFLIPGISQTLRVNGRASVFQDAAILERLAFQGKVPKLAIGVEVEEAFLHCPKAFVRSHLWETETWPDPAGVKSMGQMLESQINLPGMTAAVIDCNVEDSVRNRLY